MTHTERQYHARLATVGGERGFILLFEEGGDLVEVPEASHILFDTDVEAMAFAWELENCVDENEDDQQRYEAETSDLSDDRDALASAGFIEEA